MDKITISQRNALKSGVIYGLGLILGLIVSRLLFNAVTLEWLPTDNEAVALAIGVVIGIFIASFSVGIGGVIGGYSLQNPTKSKTQRKLAVRSGLSLGVPFGFLLFPVIFFISTISFYGTTESNPISFAIFFFILGAIYGAIAGLFLGLSTVGRHYFGHIVEAGLVGFAIGGSVLGLFIYAYLSRLDARAESNFFGLLLVLGFFLFNGIGGFALGGIYSELTIKESFAEPGPLTKNQKIRRGVYIVISVGFVLFFVNSFSDVLADMLTPSDAGLATILNPTTIGTHWAEATAITELSSPSEALQPEIFVDANGRSALTWVQDGEIYLQSGLWRAAENGMLWQAPIQVTSGANLITAVPQVIINNQQTQLIWVQENTLLQTQCSAQSCLPPTPIQNNSCGSENKANSPALTLSGEQILATWSTGDGLAYAAWSANDPVPTTVTGCLLSAPDIAQTRLSAGGNGRIALTYQAGPNIYKATFANNVWSDPENIGRGTQPDILLDAQGQTQVTWCDDTQRVNYWTENSVEIVSDIPCVSRPELSYDNNGRIHILWYSNQAQNQFNQRRDNNLIYETVLENDAWQLASIVQQTNSVTRPALSNDPNGILHMAWVNDNNIAYASQLQYSCQNKELSGIPALMLDIAQTYRDPDTIIPYCNNTYDQFIITPNPEPEYSDKPQTPNGGFDLLYERAREAKYEVLFSTMWYDRDNNLDSPGYLQAQAVADLYNMLKENPEKYPRGLTVRILLGNPPEATRAQFSDQVWSVLIDLRNAGLPEMVNEELGWRVEVANFAGSLPHAHAKMMIVDGITAVAAGYNMSYEHFPLDHPSEKGAGRFDLGLQMTGPVVQDAHRAFDDLWTGANQRTCTDLTLPDGQWQNTCSQSKAISDHVPEVLKYYLTDGDSTAFSLYRSKAYNEADKQIEAVLASATETIDAAHVNFTMPLICDLNLLYNICDFDDATPYLESLMIAAENGAQIRLLLKAEPIDGVESSVAITIMENEAEKRGVLDNFELRFFDGPMHPKSSLIDGEFLIVGSQNLHYSAFGDDGGLVEYSIGTDDPQAISDYQAMFNYYWDRAIP